MIVRRNGVIVAFVALGVFATMPSAARESMHLVEHASGETLVRHGSVPDALGDLLVFSNPLHDANDRAVVGSSRGYCVRTSVGSWWECHWTMQLAGGALVVSGSYPDQGDADFAVIGGTGGYAGARGTVRVHPRNAEHASYDFMVELL